MKSGFLEKLIARLDRLDPKSVQTHFLRLAKEKGLLETIFQSIQEGVVVLAYEAEDVRAVRLGGAQRGDTEEKQAGQDSASHGVTPTKSLRRKVGRPKRLRRLRGR